jgi:hypothetical protein
MRTRTATQHLDSRSAMRRLVSNKEKPTGSSLPAGGAERRVHGAERSDDAVNTVRPKAMCRRRIKSDDSAGRRLCVRDCSH